MNVKTVTLKNETIKDEALQFNFLDCNEIDEKKFYEELNETIYQYVQNFLKVLLIN